MLYVFYTLYILYLSLKDILVTIFNALVQFSRNLLQRILLNILQLNKTSNIAVLRTTVNIDIESSWTADQMTRRSRITNGKGEADIGCCARDRRIQSVRAITPRIQWWWSLCLSVCLAVCFSLCVSVCLYWQVDVTWIAACPMIERINAACDARRGGLAAPTGGKHWTAIFRHASLVSPSSSQYHVLVHWTTHDVCTGRSTVKQWRIWDLQLRVSGGGGIEPEQLHASYYELCYHCTWNKNMK